VILVSYMTSSNYLREYEKYAKDNNFGKIWDHYIIHGGTEQCHPNFTSHPIGNPYGTTVCKRAFRDIVPIPPANMVKKYRPMDSKPYLNQYSTMSHTMLDGYMYQLDNPTPPNERKMPNEEELMRKDYLYREKDGNGIGMGNKWKSEQIRWRQY
jgi:hypothetical protein